MGDMADLPQSLARSIYRRRYWETPGFHRVAEIAAVVAEELFDTGVNMGPAVAVGFLQRRSEEHTSELQSLMRISYAVFCLKKKILMTQKYTLLCANELS